MGGYLIYDRLHLHNQYDIIVVIISMDVYNSKNNIMDMP